MPICKICHLTTVHPPFDVRIFYKECKTLHREGYEVVLIACNEKDTIKDGIVIKALSKYEPRLQRITITLRSACKMAVRTPARIYHFHDPELIPVGMILKCIGKKVIYDVHEDYPRSLLTNDRTWIPQWSRKAVSTVVSFSEWFGAKMFDGIVTATPAIGKRFSRLNTVVIQNYPISNELVNDDPLPYKDRSNIFVYVGGISFLRGIREMIQAMTLLPRDQECKLLLAGSFDSFSVEEKVKQLPGWNDVEFVGWKSREDIAHILGQSKIGLVVFHPVPNHTEAQPNKLFEYMAAGIPVVASDFPLWREIVDGNRCGLLVDPLEPEAIAKAMNWLLEHPQEAEEMGKRGQLAVQERYNWDQEAKKLLALYERLLQ
jgi:glycosyltransferase involved in cell wall biosynthesis